MKEVCVSKKQNFADEQTLCLTLLLLNKNLGTKTKKSKYLFYFKL